MKVQKFHLPQPNSACKPWEYTNNLLYIIMCMLPHLTETLHKKKRDAIQLSSSINDIKKKIDEVC